METAKTQINYLARSLFLLRSKIFICIHRAIFPLQSTSFLSFSPRFLSDLQLSYTFLVLIIFCLMDPPQVCLALRELPFHFTAFIKRLYMYTSRCTHVRVCGCGYVPCIHFTRSNPLLILFRDGV